MDKINNPILPQNSLIEIGDANKITLGSLGFDSEGYSLPFPTHGF